MDDLRHKARRAGDARRRMPAWSHLFPPHPIRSPGDYPELDLTLPRRWAPSQPDGLDEGAEVTWAQPLITARRRRDDMIERSDSAERIEPALAKEPMANTEANDPMDPIDRTEPTLPIERIEFLDPIDRIESFDRIEHQEPWLLIAEIMARRHSDGSNPHWRGGLAAASP